jgi:hypothetical protein
VKYQVYAGRKFDRLETSVTYHQTYCHINSNLELQGEFDTFADAMSFSYLLHKCGKWTTTHIREVTQ